MYGVSRPIIEPDKLNWNVRSENDGPRKMPHDFCFTLMDKISYYCMYTPCLKKQSKFFSSELRQISTNCDNFWHKDGKEAKIIWGALILHLT